VTVRAVTAEGDILIIEESIDQLVAMRSASREPNVFYLIGTGDVLPLTDASVDEVVAELQPSPEAAAELFRVLRRGGTVRLAGANAAALNVGERMLVEAGFTGVTVATNGHDLVLSAQKP
jgi:hypothetical protein